MYKQKLKINRRQSNLQEKQGVSRYKKDLKISEWDVTHNN